MKYNRPHAGASWGTQAKDWEGGVDYDRLRRERLKRAQDAMKFAGLGAVLCFNFDNIRYLTGTHLGEWARDKFMRYCLAPVDGPPKLWDPAAPAKRISSPWVADTVAGLEGGTDDYVTKPFEFDELLARIRVRLRDVGSADVATLRAGALVLDLRARRASVGGESVELTSREFTLAETFLRHPGQVLSREQLLSHVWGYDFDPGSNIVDVYVGYLRKKLGKERIESVRGMGYRLEKDPPASAEASER